MTHPFSEWRRFDSTFYLSHFDHWGVKACALALFALLPIYMEDWSKNYLKQILSMQSFVTYRSGH